jgi:capsular exopolysaccharide synthesis family protein
METTDTKSSAGLERTVKVLRRRGWVVVLCVVLTTVAAFGLSKLQTKEYTATASLVFNDQSVAQQASGIQGATQNDPQGQRATNLMLVQLANVVAQQAAATMNHSLTAGQIKSAVSASQQGQSNVVSVSATWPNPVTAARIANAFTDAFIQQQRRSDQATVQDAITLVLQQYKGLTRAGRATTQGQSLLDRIESLRVLKAMQNNTQLVQAATVPSSPSSPKVLRNLILGAVLGLLLGLFVAFQLERFDQRLREPRDVERALDVPALGLIPHATTGLISGGRPDPGIELEPFRMLRAHLRYFNVDRQLRILMVTSGDPAEGKTTIARSLSVAAAGMGSKVLLIEADLRRPVLTAALGLAPGVGLTGALVAPDRLEEAIQHVQVEDRTNGGAVGRALDVLPAGAVPPNPAELLESHAMQDVLSWARENYELVIIDTAPLSVVPDAIPLMERVDGVIVVSRLGRSTRDGSEDLRRRLDNLGAPVLGVVVNDVPTRGAGYYRYGYATSHQTEVRAMNPESNSPDEVFARESR